MKYYFDRSNMNFKKNLKSVSLTDYILCSHCEKIKKLVAKEKQNNSFFGKMIPLKINESKNIC